MKYAIASATFVAAVAAQSCQDSVPYHFQLSPINATTSVSERDLEKRVAECTKTPIVTLQGGKLTDQDGRPGEILTNIKAKNTQFQFDNPVQSGALTEGFCINSNSTLSHPDPSGSGAQSAVFFSCISGGFSNLYAQPNGAVCSEVFLQVVQCVGGLASGGASLSSATATSTDVTSASSASSATTLATTPATTVATTPTVAPPFPAGNATAPVASGSAASGAAGSPTSTAGTSSTSPATYQPSSGANILAMGSQLLAGMAAIGAFALF